MPSEPETTRERSAVIALADFPLPSQSLTSVENYRRILEWLYDNGGSTASLVIDLSIEMSRETNRLIAQALKDTE